MKRVSYRPQLEPLEDRLALTSAAPLPTAIPLSFKVQQQSQTSPVPFVVTLTSGQFYAVNADGTVRALTGDVLQALRDGGQVSLTGLHALVIFGFENGRFELITDTHTTVRTRSLGSTMLFQASGAGLGQGTPSTETQAPQAGNSVVVDVLGSPTAGQIKLTITPAAAAVAQPASLPGSNYLIVAILLPGSSLQRFPGDSPGLNPRPQTEAFALFQPRTQGQTGTIGGNDEVPTSQEIEVEVEVQTDATDSPTWLRFSMGVDQTLDKRRLCEQVLDKIEDGLDAIKGAVEEIKGGLQPATTALEMTEAELRLSGAGLDWLADLSATATTQDIFAEPALLPAIAPLPGLADPDRGEPDRPLDLRVVMVVFLIRNADVRPQSHRSSKKSSRLERITC